MLVKCDQFDLTLNQEVSSLFCPYDSGEKLCRQIVSGSAGIASGDLVEMMESRGKGPIPVWKIPLSRSFFLPEHGFTNQFTLRQNGFLVHIGQLHEQAFHLLADFAKSCCMRI